MLLFIYTSIEVQKNLATHITVIVRVQSVSADSGARVCVCHGKQKAAHKFRVLCAATAAAGGNCRVNGQSFVPPQAARAPQAKKKKRASSRNPLKRIAASCARGPQDNAPLAGTVC
jgi:hypothetical protein